MIRSQLSPPACRSRRVFLRPAHGAAAALAALTAAACSTSAPTHSNATVPMTGLVVLSSDYASTSISLVDPATRAVVHDDCVDSNTVPPRLSLAVSGDVTLPSRPQAGGDVLLVDNGNNALTWVDPQTCTIRHQLSVGDFGAFPHDVVSISASKAYVTRFGTNSTPTADPMSRGEDLLIVNPASTPEPTIVGRIDLAPFAALVDGAVIQARPDKGLLVGDKVYVTLASQSADYTATGGGRVVIIDTATDQVSGMIDLPGLAGCTRLDYLAGSQTLFVNCGGASSDLDLSSRSGIARVDLGGATPVVKEAVPASWIGPQPLNFSWVAPVSDTLLYTATFGAFDFTTKVQTAPDAVWSVAPDSGTVARLVEGGAFNLGRAVMAGTPPVLFLPDADASHPLVHLLGDPAAPAVDLDANPSQHLPPREVAWY